MRKASRGRVLWRLSPIPVLRYGLCPSRKAWRRERRRSGGLLDKYPDTAGMTTSWRDRRGLLRVMVTIGDEARGDPLMLVNVIAHESLHVAFHVCSAMSDDDPSEEFLAYTIGEIAERLLEDYSLTWRGRAKGS